MHAEQHMRNTLNGLGWSFHHDGVTVAVQMNGKTHQVFVPVRHLWVEFGREFKAVGAPLMGVGDFSVGGWFSSLRRSISRAAKKATRAVKRGVSRVHNVAKTISKRYIAPALNVAKSVVNNTWVRRGIQLAAIAVPALAPVAVGIEAAAQALKVIDDGKRAAQNVVHAGQAGLRILQSDRHKMLQAANVQRNMANIVRMARMGNPQAQRQIGAFRYLAQRAA